MSAPTDGLGKPATAPQAEDNCLQSIRLFTPERGVNTLSGYSLGRNTQRAMETTDTEIRCCQCNKLLARGWARDAHIVHKCPRCGAYNTLRATTRPRSEPHDEPSGSKHC